VSKCTRKGVRVDVWAYMHAHNVKEHTEENLRMCSVWCLERGSSVLDQAKAWPSCTWQCTAYEIAQIFSCMGWIQRYM
jgi:hypothetical protein